MVFAAVWAHGVTPLQNSLKAGTGFKFPVLFYMIIFAVIMLAGFFFSNTFKNSKCWKAIKGFFAKLFKRKAKEEVEEVAVEETVTQEKAE